MATDPGAGIPGGEAGWWPVHRLAAGFVSAMCALLLLFRLGDSLLWLRILDRIG